MLDYIIEKMLIYANEHNIPNIYVLLSHTHFPKKVINVNLKKLKNTIEITCLFF